MNAEIIAVGTEILIGSIVNTNAQYLSQKLAAQAINVYHHTTVGDNAERLVKAFEQASSRADLIITTGGLGPTEDDITAKAAARFIGKKLVFHKPTREAIQKKLKKLGKKISPLVENQCWLPANAMVFQNDHGTAPATLSSLRLHDRTVWLLCLPGPPRELKPLFEKKALPYLLKHLKLKKHIFIVRTLNLCATESQVAEKVIDLMKLKPPATLGIYAKPGLVELKIMARDSTLAKTKAHVARLERILRERLGDMIFGVDQETLADAIGMLMKKHGQTLALAESCTGGLLGYEIVQSAGASAYFKGSVVAYANSVKSELLSIPLMTIQRSGAVSDVVAGLMAQHVRRSLRTDYGVSITGIAGPSGGSRSKPVGLVYIGVSGPSRTEVTKHLFLGTRSDVQRRAALKAMDRLRLTLLRSDRRAKH